MYRPCKQSSLELVTVLETDNSFGLSLAKPSLEEAGIAYVVMGEALDCLPGIHGASGIGATPIWKGRYRVQVNPDSELEARVLLEPLRSPVDR